jgi:hypothetical protein
MVLLYITTEIPPRVEEGQGFLGLLPYSPTIIPPLQTHVLEHEVHDVLTQAHEEGVATIYIYL